MLEVITALIITSQMLPKWASSDEAPSLVLKMRGVGRLRDDLRRAIVFGKIQDQRSDYDLDVCITVADVLSKQSARLQTLVRRKVRSMVADDAISVIL